MSDHIPTVNSVRDISENKTVYPVDRSREAVFTVSKIDICRELSSALHRSETFALSMEVFFPLKYTVQHCVDIENPVGKTFADQFFRNVLVIFFEVRHLVLVD